MKKTKNPKNYLNNKYNKLNRNKKSINEYSKKFIIKNGEELKKQLKIRNTTKKILIIYYTKKKQNFISKKKLYKKIYSNKESQKQKSRLSTVKSFLKIILILIFIFLQIYPFSFLESNKIPIKIAFYNNCIRYGGIERVTSILLNYFSKEKIFIFYLITISGILENEYPIPRNILRISLNGEANKLYGIIDKEKIDILIYNFDNFKEMEQLNKLNKTKVIYCSHSSFFYSIYRNVYN